MKIFTLILFILLSFGSFSQTKNQWQLKSVDFKTNYFYGQKGKGKHMLTFNSDSTFQITVPADGASCFLWGEFGGHMQVKGDTIIFNFVGIDQKPQVFVIKDAKTIKRISKDGFMCEKYKLTKRNDKPAIKKKDLYGKWDLDSFADSIKIGDTLLFKSDKKGNDTFLRRNGTLQKHTFYAHCGNKYFADYFTRKPPDWETIGSWHLSTADNKTILTLNIGNKPLTFLLASQDKGQIKFILQNI